MNCDGACCCIHGRLQLDIVWTEKTITGTIAAIVWIIAWRLS